MKRWMLLGVALLGCTTTQRVVTLPYVTVSGVAAGTGPTAGHSLQPPVATAVQSACEGWNRGLGWAYFRYVANGGQIGVVVVPATPSVPLYDREKKQVNLPNYLEGQVLLKVLYRAYGYSMGLMDMDTPVSVMYPDPTNTPPFPTKQDCDWAKRNLGVQL